MADQITKQGITGIHGMDEIPRSLKGNDLNQRRAVLVALTRARVKAGEVEKLAKCSAIARRGAIHKY